ncbi:MAG: hypothetical protein WA133_05430 [Syntrophales bacterium]
MGEGIVIAFPSVIPFMREGGDSFISLSKRLGKPFNKGGSKNEKGNDRMISAIGKKDISTMLLKEAAQIFKELKWYDFYYFNKWRN